MIDRLFHDLDRNRPAVHDMADLTFIGSATAECVDVTDEDHIARPGMHALALDHQGNKGVRRVRVRRLFPALAARRPPPTLGCTVEPGQHRGSILRQESPGDAGHAELVLPVPQVAGLPLLLPQLAGILRPQR